MRQLELKEREQPIAMEKTAKKTIKKRAPQVGGTTSFTGKEARAIQAIIS